MCQPSSKPLFWGSSKRKKLKKKEREGITVQLAEPEGVEWTVLAYPKKGGPWRREGPWETTMPQERAMGCGVEDWHVTHIVAAFAWVNAHPSADLQNQERFGGIPHF